MAQGRHQVSDATQVEQRISSFHLNPVEDAAGTKPASGAETETQDGAESDAGQDQAGDASEQAQGDGDGADQGGDSGEGDGDSRQGDPAALIAKQVQDSLAEYDRNVQSRMDRMFARMERQFQSATTQTTTEADPQIPEIPDDDVVTGKQLKEITTAASKRARNEQARQAEAVRKQSWVQQQPDTQEVVAFMRENNLFSEDSPLRDVPVADEVGMYYAAKALMVEKKMKDSIKAEVDKALGEQRKKITKTGRSSVPPTGGTGAPNGSRTRGQSLEPVNKSERNYLDFFDRISGPGARIVEARRG